MPLLIPTTIAFRVEKSSDNCLKGVDNTAHSSFKVRPIKTADPSKNSVSLLTPKVKKTLDFSENTLYEIFDTYGNLVKKGYGQSINVENLEKGLYYVNYDAKTGEVVSKK